jgi:hypothetical protein
MNLITAIHNQKAIALDTDHTMVIVRMKLTLPGKTRRHRYVVSSRIDHNKLKEKDLCEQYDSTKFLPTSNYTNYTTNNTTTNTTIITTSNIDYIYEGWKRNVVGNRIFRQEKKE